ncbi:prealbumin-like fold domain-containing protein, partial [Corynebacterium sp. HMSC05E07]|uniref:SpaA isopeptide-forming pilin-related protein n=1 Tax=Corynebacterium sp. HMSC05E07 TaxID=1581117 RepID=UPI001FF03145
EADEALVAYDDASDVDALTEEIASVETPIDEAPASASDSAPASDSASASGGEASEASEAVEKPEGSKDPVSVVRDGDIDTVTIDDRDTKAWRDSETGMEKVSDDALYGISRESDAGIDEIVEVEADGIVVDEKSYGFIHDDEDELDKIVIDYYGLKTAPPEMLTLKVKSSKEGEYSILDKDDIPAKADVQDAGFLPDPSAEKQEKIDKVNKENRAADTQTGSREVELKKDVEVLDPSGARPTFVLSVGGSPDNRTTLYANKILLEYMPKSMAANNKVTNGLADSNRTVEISKGSTTCRLQDSDGAYYRETTTGKTNYLEIDMSKCNAVTGTRKAIDFWEAGSDQIKVKVYSNLNGTDADFDFSARLWASTERGDSIVNHENETQLIETTDFVDTPQPAPGFDVALQTLVLGPDRPYRDLYLGKIYIYDPDKQLDKGLNSVKVQKGPHVSNTTVPAKRLTGDKQDYIEIDVSGLSTAEAKKFAVWEGSRNRVIAHFNGVGAVDPSRLDMRVYASPVQGQTAKDVDLQASAFADVKEQETNAENLTTNVKPVDGANGRDFNVTFTRDFPIGGTLGDEVTARLDHVNGTYLDNDVMVPTLKVLDADGNPIKELEGKAYDRYRLATDKAGNDWGGLTFDGLEGVKVPSGGKIVVEMGFRQKPGSPIKDREHRLPLGPGEVVVDLAKTDDHFELVKGEGEDAIEARAEATKRDDEAFEDVITIGSRSKFSGAKVTVDAPNSILTGEAYSFQISGENNTGLEQGYSLKKTVISADKNKVVYEVYPVDEAGNRATALVEEGTKFTVSSAFSRTPETVTTTVELSGKKLKKAAEKTWTEGTGGDINLYPVFRLHPLIMTNSAEHGFNGSPGPFVLKNEKGQVVSYGGLCIQPNLGYPDTSEPVRENWELFPSDYSPVSENPISLENQGALGYLVKQLNSAGGGNASKARQQIINNAERIAREAGVKDAAGRYYTGAQAYAVVYGAVLNLLGYNNDNLDEIFSQYTSAENPKRHEIIDKGAVIAKYVLSNDDLEKSTDYQIVRFKSANAQPWQMVLVPGGGGKGNSRMSTTAALDGDKDPAKVDYGEWRNTRVNIENVDKAYDRIDYVGLTAGDYKLKTELVRVDADKSEHVIYSKESDAKAESSAQSSWYVKVDLSDEKISEEWKAGSRYVFKETVKDSKGNVIVEHVSADDEAQSFWIEEKPQLKGANFTFTKVSADNHEDKLEKASFVIADNKEMEGAKSVSKAENDSTTFTVENLEVGKQYWIAETRAPQGDAGKNYQLLPKPISFKIDNDGKLKFWSAGEWTTGDAFPFVDPKSTTDKTTGKIHATANIANVWIGDLPKTGGNGIAPWLLLG